MKLQYWKCNTILTIFYHTVQYGIRGAFALSEILEQRTIRIQFGSSLEARVWAMALWRGGVVAWRCAPQAEVTRQDVDEKELADQGYSTSKVD